MQVAPDPNPTDPLGANASLRDLLDVGSLEDVLSSFYALFQIPIRVLSPDGRALAKNRKQPALHEYLAELPGVPQRLGEVYEALRQREPGEDGQFSLTCFTGASYHVCAIAHDGRRIGRVVLGPFLAPGSVELPSELPGCAPGIDVARTKELLGALPRVREETIRAIARHLGVLLDALIFAGHKAWLTESMHLSAVQESFRELADKAELLQQAEQRIHDLDRSRASFLAEVADELSVQLSVHNAEQLRELARQLSDLAHLERGALRLQKSQVDPGAMLAEVQAELNARLEGPSIELGLPSAERLPPIWADRKRLGQALRLLARDALGVEPALLRLEASRTEAAGDGAQSGAWVLLGAPRPAVLEFRVIHGRRPLDDFERGLPGAAQLARAVAARLAEAHGGALRVEDHPPTGAAFVLTLPVDEAGSQRV
jgi:two-component system, NarL family, sensor histidine kinase BarA